MKKLFAITILLMIPAFSANANDTDTAIIELRGNVPARVSIDIADNELDFGEIGESDIQDSFGIDIRSNVPFTLSVSSENDGVLLTDGDVEGLASSYDYTISFEGRDGDIFDENLNERLDLITTGQRGRDNATFTVNVDALDSILDNPEEDIPAEGTYEDVLTFTIEAE